MGLQKLDSAASEVGVMQRTLEALKPKLVTAAARVADTVRIVEVEKVQAEAVEKVVMADEAVTNEQAKAAQAIADECNVELEKAQPIVDAAIAALKTIEDKDIAVVKTLKSPPDAIKLVMEAICILRDVKPDRIPNPSGIGKIEDYWGPSKRILGDIKFKETLLNFPKDDIQDRIMQRLRSTILKDERFVPSKIETVSHACAGTL